MIFPPGHQHLYPPDTSSLVYRPPMGLTGRHTAHPGPTYQISSSTAGTSGSGSLQLPHQYGQTPHFPYAPSTNPQNTYHPSPAFPSRQNLPYSVLQPLPTYLTPSALPQTVGYVSPVTSSLASHQAATGASYSAMQPAGSTDRLPGTQPPVTAAFSSDTYSPSQGAPADQHPNTTPPQGWNPNPPNYPN